MERTKTSVAEALGRAHVALLRDLKQLEQAVQPASGEDGATLSRRLGATRTHVTEHFRFEEQNGYMAAVRKQQPRLERAIQLLADEHRQLSQSLDALLEEAHAAPSLTDALRERVREWVHHVGQHELRENDLVQDSYNLEIGTED